MYSMLSTPLICASMGPATDWDNVCASAPGYTAVTCTCTGVIDGYCSTGRFMAEMTPANTITSDNTVAKIGRSINTRENMILPPDYCACAGF